MSSELEPLSEIAIVQGGYAFKSADFGDEGVAVVKIANIQPPLVSLSGVDRVKPSCIAGLDRFELADGDILMAMTGATVGKVGRFRSSERAFLNQRVARITAKDGREFDDFIYAVLSVSGFDKLIESASAGSAQANISAAGIGSISISKVGQSDRLVIGRIARALDDRITLLRETNATLEAIAQALFKSWFVDFDPVRAKAEGRQPEGMDATTAALFPDSFEESELGLVPKGWLVKPLGDFSEILNGFAFKSEDYVEGSDGVFLLRTTNFESGGFAARLDKDVFLPKKFLENFSKFICAPFDFHLVMVGASVGKTSLLLPHMLPALRNQNMWCFRAKGGFESIFFIHEAVKIKISEALRSTSGSAREFLRKGDFALSSAVVPTPDLLSAFEKTISALKNKVAINEHQALTLSNIRDTLLPRLISGQLRLPDAEHAVEEALA